MEFFIDHGLAVFLAEWEVHRPYANEECTVFHRECLHFKPVDLRVNFDNPDFDYLHPDIENKRVKGFLISKS